MERRFAEVLSEFRKYEELMERRFDEELRVFWNEDNDVSVSGSLFDFGLKDAIRSTLRSMPFKSYYGSPVLVQFWASKTIEGRCFLTTSDQPFAMKEPHQGLCMYRTQCMSHKYSVENWESKEKLGPPGRVYLRKLPERTRHFLRHYSSKDYPLLDLARSANIQAYCALPLFDKSGLECVGVLEVLSAGDLDLSLIEHLLFSAVMVTGLVSLKIPCSEYRELEYSEGGKLALLEISEGLDFVCKTHGFTCAQTWISCRHYGDVDCQANLEKSCIGGVITTRKASYIAPDKIFSHKDRFDIFNIVGFFSTCSFVFLGKGDGVVGRALSSSNSCFCRDISELSIAEYSLAYYARQHKLSSCFAICLQSSHTGNPVYILEFFLHSDCLNGPQLQTMLDSLLVTMKEHFRSFKVTSGQELGEKLLVEVIKSSMDDELESFEIGQTIRSPPRLEAIQNGGETEEVSLLGRQSVLGVDATNNGQNVFCARQHDTQVSYSSKEHAKKTSKRQYKITREDLENFFGMTLTKAAEHLGVSRSTLKRNCRENNIEWWPSGKRGKVNRSLSRPIHNAEEIPNSIRKDPLCALVSSSTPVTAMQDASLTIKATYEDHVIKFKLSLFATMLDLEKKVTDRLRLKEGTFHVKYLDKDEELILIACDDDLQECMAATFNTSDRSVETTIRMTILPIINRAS